MGYNKIIIVVVFEPKKDTIVMLHCSTITRVDKRKL